MAKILLVDDSIDIGALLTAGLHPHAVSHALSLAQAEAALKQEEFDILLIDVKLPDGNGFDFCVRLCQDERLKAVPKIMLTALNDTSEKVFGFNCGADDYITKPFHLVELRVRVDRFLRKTEPAKTVTNYFGFSFDMEFQKCFMQEGDSQIDLGLTPTEFRLLLALVKSEGRVLTRRMLEQASWEANGTSIQIRGIDTHIAHLRRKLGPMKDMIVSVYGQGYSFDGALTKSKAA